MPEMTPHIGLKKPIATETADISVINDNMDMIDSALGDLSTVPTTAKDAAGAIAELHSEIEAIDVNIPDATLTTKGKVQLSSATNSTAEDRAATPKAVKTTMDAAVAAQTTANAAQAKSNAALPASSYTAADILAKLKTVDGVGSGLDADLLAGRNSLQYAHAGTVNAAQLNNSVFPAGLYVTNEALSLGLPWLWAHIINLKHASQDGYNAQIATPLDVTSGDMYVRYSVGTAWTTWKRIWTDNALRVNAGQLEFYDGGTWKPVANNGISVASNTVQFEDATERTTTNSTGILVCKYAPKASGEIVVSAEVRTLDGVSNQTTFLHAMSAYRRQGASSVSGEIGNLSSLGAASPDWRTPLGTNMSSRTILDETIGSWTTSTYAAISRSIVVFEGVPVYLALSRSNTGGGQAFMRNLKISYDIVR
ncbi:pyocin knob domain-containing protein [Cohnella phaseoli]|uniref:Tail fiber-like repeat protein n=1 Tax=Cohnella phaseoli TaxID=456490 RepID=A0A3D9KL72_9BACL|nr:pyocin knob domain-containing protein [Cohnella phaseoli]RED86333.1 tail fiber-like repeat protein [Cohnella phaseoli]